MTGAEHRRLQLALRAVVLRELLTIWPTFQPGDIAGSWPAVEAAAVPLIQARGLLSAQLAARYFDSLGGSSVLAPIPDASTIADSLRVVGPANAGKLVASNTALQTIADTTFVNVSGDVTRQVLNVGRATLAASMVKDRRVRGYRRVTDGSPCKFCAGLAGQVHATDAHFAAHSHCGCFAEPVMA